MDFPDDREFDFSFDKKEHNGEYAGEILEKKVDSLGWKVTFMAVIIPCLIGVVVVLSYFSITKKVADFQDTGSATVQEFAQVYDGKLTDMQESLAAHEAAVEKKLAEISRNAAAIKNNQNSIKGNQSGIKDNQNAIKSSQDSVKSLAAADSKMSAAVGNLQKDMEKLTAAVGEASRQMIVLRQQIEAMETRLAGLTDMTADKLDTETVRRMLTDFEKKFQSTIGASSSAVTGKLKSLEGRMSTIERQLGVSSQGPAPTGSPDIIEENL